MLFVILTCHARATLRKVAFSGARLHGTSDHFTPDPAAKAYKWANPIPNEIYDKRSPSHDQKALPTSQELNRNTMNSLKILFFLFLATCFVQSHAQQFNYGIHAGYTQIKYAFPVEKDRFHASDIQPFNALKVGISGQYAVTSLFRVGTGLEYMAVSGEKNGGSIGRVLVNPNSQGELHFKVDNTFLIVPVGFNLQMFGDKRVRPTLSGALQFFKPLNQNITIRIEPDDPDPSYEEVRTVIDGDTKSSYFGTRFGAGVTASLTEGRELSLMLVRHLNVSRYELSDPIMGSFEKHQIVFNMWEISLGFTMGF